VGDVTMGACFCHFGQVWARELFKLYRWGKSCCLFFFSILCFGFGVFGQWRHDWGRFWVF